MRLLIALEHQHQQNDHKEEKGQQLGAQKLIGNHETEEGEQLQSTTKRMKSLVVLEL
jgi:hypothetical protein